MNLDSFIFEQLQRIERFEAFWREQQADKPECFPDELTAGEWEDQLLIYSGLTPNSD